MTNTDERSLGFLGEPGVNVLLLNLAVSTHRLLASHRVALVSFASISALRPGVGKTFAMLNEGRRRNERGTDVVAGFVETHGRPRTADAIGDLEVVPRRTIEHRGAAFEEMDVDAVLARNPPSPWSTSSRTRMFPARATRSAGRTSPSCSMPGST